MSKDETTPPAAGQVTAAQKAKSQVGTSWGIGGDSPVDPGTFETYREMKANPTIALARLLATAPIRTAEWGVDADDGVDDAAKEFVQAQVARFWPALINDLMLSLDYGFQAFEVVWTNENADGRAAWGIEKVKPLLPDVTILLVDEKTGAFRGVKNQDVTLLGPKCFRYTYDEEAGNYYGRSRHENVRENAWNDWRNIQRRRRLYAKRVAGAVPMVEYPDGDSTDQSGAIRPNWEIAKNVVTRLENCDGIYMPNVLAAISADLVRSGVDMEKMRAWRIGFLEAKGEHGKELTQMMEHCESLMMRGWLVPERAGTEARQSGSRADSQTHADAALVIADLVLLDVVGAINAGLINPLLQFNYGADMVGRVRIVRAGLNPELLAFFRAIIQAVLSQPANLDVLVETVDLNALFDQVGLPKKSETIDVSGLAPRPAAGGGTEVPSALAASIIGAVKKAYQRAHVAMPRTFTLSTKP